MGYNKIMIKKDKYLKARGGTAHLIYVSCAKCGKKILLYQKDGPGWLKRCYLNRISGIDGWENLRFDKNIRTPKDMPNLICKCGNLVGTPMVHKDRRLAFCLVRGTFKRRKLTNKELMLVQTSGPNFPQTSPT